MSLLRRKRRPVAVVSTTTGGEKPLGDNDELHVSATAALAAISGAGSLLSDLRDDTVKHLYPRLGANHQRGLEAQFTSIQDQIDALLAEFQRWSRWSGKPTELVSTVTPGQAEPGPATIQDAIDWLRGVPARCEPFKDEIRQLAADVHRYEEDLGRIRSLYRGLLHQTVELSVIISNLDETRMQAADLQGRLRHINGLLAAAGAALRDDNLGLALEFYDDANEWYHILLQTARDEQVVRPTLLARHSQLLYQLSTTRNNLKTYRQHGRRYGARYDLTLAAGVFELIDKVAELLDNIETALDRMPGPDSKVTTDFDSAAKQLDEVEAYVAEIVAQTKHFCSLSDQLMRQLVAWESQCRGRLIDLREEAAGLEALSDEIVRAFGSQDRAIAQQLAELMKYLEEAERHLNRPDAEGNEVDLALRQAELVLERSQAHQAQLRKDIEETRQARDERVAALQETLFALGADVIELERQARDANRPDLTPLITDILERIGAQRQLDPAANVSLYADQLSGITRLVEAAEAKLNEGPSSLVEVAAERREPVLALVSGSGAGESTEPHHPNHASSS